MEQLKEMLSVLDSMREIQAPVSAAIMEELDLDKYHRRIWDSPEHLIRWLYSAREAWE